MTAARRPPVSRNVLSCYDCGSTIRGHHTPLCELAPKGAKHDLPQIPGTQYWDTPAIRARHGMPALVSPVDDGPREYRVTVALRTKKHPRGEFLFRTDYKSDRAQTIALARQLSDFYGRDGYVNVVSRSLTLSQEPF